jgi:hypothetical protein
MLLCRGLLNPFLTPIKQLGAVIEVAGKGVGSTPIADAGKAMRRLIAPPEEKLTDLFKNTNEFCEKVSNASVDGNM